MRYYRKKEKRRAYQSYILFTRMIKSRLENGEIDQEEFERLQEALDDRFRFVK